MAAMGTANKRDAGHRRHEGHGQACKAGLANTEFGKYAGQSEINPRPVRA